MIFFDELDALVPRRDDSLVSSFSFFMRADSLMTRFMKQRKLDGRKLNDCSESLPAAVLRLVALSSSAAF